MEEVSPTHIGKYRVLGVLGTGSMGTVYQAEDPEIGRSVAIKVIRVVPSSPYMDEASCLERFKLEARSAGNLRHNNIVTLFDVNTEAKPPYLVMDHIDGVGLDTIIQQKGKLDPYDACHYLYQIAQGLDYAHAKGIIHRDIKPSNILIDKDGNAYILDFGVATITGHTHYDVESPIVGSPAYMSPEQILNEELDSRADIFSLGVLAFECFTGYRPFDGEDFTVVARHIIKGERHSLDEFVPGLPISLEAEFEKAFSRIKSQRFKTAAIMIMVFCDALGIKNPLGGTSEMRGYGYIQGGDKNSDVFKELAPRHDAAQSEPSSVVTASKVRHRFGDIKPVLQKNESRPVLNLLMVVAVGSLLFGLLLLSYALREEVPILKPVGDIVATILHA